jgi:hypothetical protein
VAYEKGETYLHLSLKKKNAAYKYPNILKPSHSSYLPADEDGKECSETSAYKIQTPENYPEENIQHSEQAKV